MPKETFSYFPLRVPPDPAHPTGSTSMKPVLLDSLSTSDGAFTQVAMLLDTGSDDCMVPMKTAIALGLDLSTLPSALVDGVGGRSILVYYTTLRIELPRSIVFETEVGLSEGLDHIGFSLLGQNGFFDRFNVEFRLAEGLFTLEPANKLPIQ